MARVLVLVNPATLQILSTKDYLSSFELFSENEVSYLPEVPPAWTVGGQTSRRTESDYREILSAFDAVVVSQHLRLCFDGWINDNLYKALLSFEGVKAVFLHDEYDHTEKTRAWIEEQEVDLVYTVVPEPHVTKVYKPTRFPKTEFRSILTGYMPLKFSRRNKTVAISEREKLLVYRGRVSPESYGALAKQKETIGRYFDDYCQKYEIEADIQWEEAERVYGLNWYRLLETGVATLGTESGSNVFDEYGHIRERVAQGKPLPGPVSLNFREENLGFKMNQISARLFEAIGCGTALVLYEGDYSGVLDAGDHFLSVKHDHSNVAEVVEKLNDSMLVQKMVDRAWYDVSSNSELSFNYLVGLFDADLKKHISRKGGASVSSEYQQHLLVGEFSDVSATGIGVFSALHNYSSSQSLNFSGPSKVRNMFSDKLRNLPLLKRMLKRVYVLFSSALLKLVHAALWSKIRANLTYAISLLKMQSFHWLRKCYRVVPNTFPVLGQLKRKFFSK